jgi:hypothetical protein
MEGMPDSLRRRPESHLILQSENVVAETVSILGARFSLVCRTIVT